MVAPPLARSPDAKHPSDSTRNRKNFVIIERPTWFFRERGRSPLGERPKPPGQLVQHALVMSWSTPQPFSQPAPHAEQPGKQKIESKSLGTLMKRYSCFSKPS